MSYPHFGFASHQFLMKKAEDLIEKNEVDLKYLKDLIKEFERRISDLRNILPKLKEKIQ